jgi:hypothetical protein
VVLSMIVGATPEGLRAVIEHCRPILERLRRDHRSLQVSPAQRRASSRSRKPPRRYPAHCTPRIRSTRIPPLPLIGSPALRLQRTVWPSAMLPVAMQAVQRGQQVRRPEPGFRQERPAALC